MNYTSQYLDPLPDQYETTVDVLLNHVSLEPNRVALESVGDLYYRSIDSKKELFCAELPEYTGVENLTQFYGDILEYVSNTWVKNYHIRDVVRKFRDFCYYHGYKYDDSSLYQPIPQDSDTSHPLEPVILRLNTQIEEEVLTNQQAGLICTLINSQLKIANKQNTVYSINEIILDLLSLFISVYQSKEITSQMDWNRFGGGIDVVYNELHHNILKEMD